MNLLKDISTVSGYEPTQGALLKLFRLVVQEEVQKEEAVSFFPSSNYFRVTYKKLKDNLLDGILLNSFSDLTKTQQLHFSIRKRNLESLMLLISGKKKSGIVIAEETYIRAVRNGLVDIAFTLSRQLEYHYSVIDLNKQKRLKYKVAVEKNFLYLQQEMEAQSVFADLGFCVQKDKDISHIPDKIHLLSEYCKKNENYLFRLYYYSTKNLYYRYVGNTTGIIETSKTAIAFFDNFNGILPYTTKWNFNFQLIPIYLSDKQYGEAEVLINRSLNYPTIGSYNWHLTLLYKVVLGFYSEKPSLALQAWKRSNQVAKKFDSKRITEHWKITNAYLSFFEKIGHIQGVGKFRLYRFLNDINSLRAGKANILIIELLHLVVSGKKTAYMNRTEQIEAYIQNHLKEHKHRRARRFLRMLRAIELGDYNLMRVQAHAKKHVDKLSSKGMVVNINVLDAEPVPYEFLWEVLIEWLGRR